MRRLETAMGTGIVVVAFVIAILLFERSRRRERLSPEPLQPNPERSHPCRALISSISS
jgi:hypothetical protein